MEEIELLLTDEFVEFSKRIGEILAQKKSKTDEFRQIHAEFKRAIADLDDSARQANVSWEEFKSQKGAAKA